MSWIKEFKDFASKGNLVDVAVAFVMGAAFGKVISSLTEGIVSPLISLITGGVDFSKKQLVLRKASQVFDESGTVVSEVAEVTVKYGAFLTAAIDFLIVAWVMFLLVKAINKLKRKQEEAPAAPPEPSSTDKLLMEIRDALKNK
ncbi:MAG: large-conductance mechanosensitive channel protein MscL [Chitinophagaceae bacterium]|jgi:large conductance mechanosensitive channel|nr:large-conductance mechanosensitive channel protein MscL [Chitinophagaceae bacterium]